MIGPGEYVPHLTAGIARPEDLPLPRIVRRRRIYRKRPCPRCGRQAPRYGLDSRCLFDLGDVASGCPIEVHVTFSRHRCRVCRRCFAPDLSALALPKCLYTRRVQRLAVRLVVEDALPYRSASWHLWRDHQVFVPYATIQNWVEAAGKKKPDGGSDALPRASPGKLQRLYRR